MSVLDPLTHALAAVVAGTRTTLTHLGAESASSVTWLLCLAAVVVVVRLALLPLVVHGVRMAHAGARARPQLQALTRKHRDHLKDPERMRVYVEERRRISAEHGVSRLGCLPLLVQLPIWFALYRVVSDVAAGVPVGAMSSELVASLGAATLVGVPLADRGYLGGGTTHLLVVAGLAVTAAVLSFVTQRFLVAPNTVLTDAPEVMVKAQQWMPVMSAVGMVVAGGVVPVALLVYWVLNSTWTCGQSAVVWRWFPTPGSPAAGR